MITALFADENGEIFDDPEFLGLGRIGAETILLKPQDLIPLPEGADLMLLPHDAIVRQRGVRSVRGI